MFRWTTKQLGSSGILELIKTIWLLTFQYTSQLNQSFVSIQYIITTENHKIRQFSLTKNVWLTADNRNQS